MADPALQRTIETLWERRDTLSPATAGADREAVEAALARLDPGRRAWPSRPMPAGWCISG